MSELSKRLKGVKIETPRLWGRQPSILVSGNIPKPMHGMAPRVVLGAKWWNKTRKLAYRSTNFHCQACAVYKLDAPLRWLEGHELYSFDYLLGRMTYVRTVPLCHYCHNYVHSGRLQALLDQGKIPQSKYAAIIQHGDRVLAAARLRKPEPYSGPFADWGDWRLIVYGREYAGKFKSIEDWVAYHSKGNTPDVEA